jgi:hypothetical protein
MFRSGTAASATEECLEISARRQHSIDLEGNSAGSNSKCTIEVAKSVDIAVLRVGREPARSECERRRDGCG